MSGFFDDEEAPVAAAPIPPGRSRSRALIGTAVALVALFFVVSVFTGIYTDRLWFASVGYSKVFTTVLRTRVELFVVFGLLMGVAVGANIFVAYRLRPTLRPGSPDQAGLERYRDVVHPLRRWLLIGVSLILGLFAGSSGAGAWRQYLLWRHRVPFGTTDPYFHRDVGFYVFDLPWFHFLVNVGMTITVLSLIAAAVVHYLFGGIRLQVQRDRMSGAAQAQFSILAGVFVLFKALDYWLDRFDLDVKNNNLFTGMGYTGQHAVLPSKNILMFIALICALLFFANVIRRTWLLPTIGLGLLVLSAILIGAIWPAIVQQFQVHPSELDKQSPYIAKNIQATRTAFAIGGTQITDYDAKQTLDKTQLSRDAQSIPGIRLQDPSLVRSAFEQLQQVRGYYSVAPVLDVDRYPIDGRSRDVVIAAREVDLTGLPTAQRNWTNLHTVYTHGYGLIAAYGNQSDAQDKPVTTNDGKPVWAEQDLPPRGQLTDEFPPNGYEPRIYYGEESPAYSIVGRLPGHRSVELDLPAEQGANPRTNTYHGATGVGVGSTFRQVLYALKFSDPNIVLSSRVNADSRILYDRSPRDRVQKVAPWLTTDSDVYPAVVDGRIKWIVDCYTTTDNYPNSERGSLSDMTSDSLNPSTSYATLPTDNINYMRNSVKAVVDAYSGTVTLYAWDTSDPLLKAWSAVFPGVVQPRSTIPHDLLEHMRYPEDLFKVQRTMLATYHVQDPQTFYETSDKWVVPQDPEIPTKSQPPYRLSVRTPTGGPKPVFSLTSVYTPNKRQTLAAFISVDSDPTQQDYGTIRILRLPNNTPTPGPSQIANFFGSDPQIAQKLLAFTRTKSKVIYGNLLTLPIGDGLLYVQPLYTQRQTGQGTYPVLRYVLVSFGQDAGIGTTLEQALNDVLGIKTTTPPTTGNGGGTTPPTGTVSKNVRDLLQQADAQFNAARRALQAGDLQTYANHEARAEALVKQALAAAQKSTQKPTKQG